MQKKFIVFILSTLVVFATGCETFRGLAVGARGLAVGAGTTVAETTQGVAKDTYNLTYNFCKFIQAADNWIKKNLW